MPKIQLNTSIAPVTPSNARNDCVDNQTVGCFHKFRMRITTNPEKKLNKLNYGLFLSEQSFAINLYMGYKYSSIEDCLDKLIRKKITAFNVTNDNPYVFDREAEKKFLTALVDARPNIEAGKYAILAQMIRHMDIFAASAEKKRIQYTRYRQYQSTRDKNSSFFKNRPIEYKLRIEVMVNEYYKHQTQVNSSKNANSNKN